MSDWLPSPFYHFPHTSSSLFSSLILPVNSFSLPTSLHSSMSFCRFFPLITQSTFFSSIFKQNSLTLSSLSRLNLARLSLPLYSSFRNSALLSPPNSLYFLLYRPSIILSYSCLCSVLSFHTRVEPVILSSHKSMPFSS